MKILHSILIFFVIISSNAQYTITGNFSPVEDFKWAIVYELTPGGTRYVADTQINQGQLNLKMPQTVAPGLYRLVYAVPQDEYFIDFIYNCKEDIAFNFNLESGITFTNSFENQLYADYFTEIGEARKQLMDYYNKGKNADAEYLKITNAINSVQNKYESASKNTIANNFIAANKNYLLKNSTSQNEFLKSKKTHYFDYFDFQNKTLQASSFFKEKILNYMLWALPPEATTRVDLVKGIKENVQYLAKKLTTVPRSLQVNVFHEAWKKAYKDGAYEISDYIFTSVLKDLAIKSDNTSLVNELETKTRLRVGAVSPEITWENNGKKQTLSGQEGYDTYVLIFWSSTCSHCLKEIPGLHESLKSRENLKVIAVGLEDTTENWEKVTASLPTFSHAIALGKWESEAAHIFNIQKTPSYYILDKDKHILSRPDNSEDVLEYLKNN